MHSSSIEIDLYIIFRDSHKLCIMHSNYELDEYK